MRVMLNHGNAYKLHDQFPDHVGLFAGPTRSVPQRGLPVALDNGRFPCWTHNKSWDENLFWKMLDRYDDPLWIVVPDVVTDAVATFEEWNKWEPRLHGKYKLALAVQDGMTPEAVMRHSNPDVIFVGGSTQWKRRTMWMWCQEFDHVHIGRINTEKWLWNAKRCGATSCDGTGWFRGDKKQLAGLMRYLDRASRGLSTPQLELEFSDGFHSSATS